MSTITTESTTQATTSTELTIETTTVTTTPAPSTKAETQTNTEEPTTATTVLSSTAISTITTESTRQATTITEPTIETTAITTTPALSTTTETQTTTEEPITPTTVPSSSTAISTITAESTRQATTTTEPTIETAITATPAPCTTTGAQTTTEEPTTPTTILSSTPISTITTESTRQATTITEPTIETTAVTTTPAPSTTIETQTTPEETTTPTTPISTITTESTTQSTTSPEPTIETTAVTTTPAPSTTIETQTTPEETTTRTTVPSFTTPISTITTESTRQATTNTEPTTETSAVTTTPAPSTTTEASKAESTNQLTINIATSTTAESLKTTSTTPKYRLPTTTLSTEVTTTTESKTQATTETTTEGTIASTPVSSKSTEASTTTEETAINTSATIPTTITTQIYEVPTKESTTQAATTTEPTTEESSGLTTMFAPSTTKKSTTAEENLTSTPTTGSPTTIHTTVPTKITTPTNELSTTTFCSTQATTSTEPTKAESSASTTTLVPGTASETTATEGTNTATNVPQTTILTTKVTSSTESTTQATVTTEPTTAESSGLTTTLAQSTTKEALTTTKETPAATLTTLPPTTLLTPEVTHTTSSTQATTTTEPITAESTTVESMTTESTGLTMTLVPSTSSGSTTTKESQSTILTTVPQTTTKIIEATTISQYTSQATITMEQTAAQSAASMTILSPSTTPEASSNTVGAPTMPTTEVPTMSASTTQATTSTESTATASTTALSTIAESTGLTTTISPDTTEETPSTTPTTVPPTPILDMTTTTESTIAESTELKTTLSLSTTKAPKTTEETASTTPTTVQQTSTKTMDMTRTPASTTVSPTAESTRLTTLAPSNTNEASTTTEEIPSTTPKPLSETTTQTMEAKLTTEFTTQAPPTTTLTMEVTTPTTVPQITQTMEATTTTKFTTQAISPTEPPTGESTRVESTGLITTITPSTTTESSTSEETQLTTFTTMLPTTTLNTLEVTTTTEPTTAESTILTTIIAPFTTIKVQTATEETSSTTPATAPLTKTLTTELTTTTESTSQTATAERKSTTTKEVSSKTESTTESTATTSSLTTSTVTKEQTAKETPTIPPTTTPTNTVTTIFTTQPTQTTQPTESIVSITFPTPTNIMEALTTTVETQANTPTTVTLIATSTTKVTTTSEFTTQSTTTTEQTVTSLVPNTNTEEPTTTKETHRTYPTIPPAIITPTTEVTPTTEPTTQVATTTELTTAVPTASTISIAPSTTTEAPPTTQPSTTLMTKLITISVSTLEPTSTTETTTEEPAESSISVHTRTTTEAPTTTEGTLTTTFSNVPSPTTAKTTIFPNLSTSTETLATTPTTLPPFTIPTTETHSSSESSTQTATITEAIEAKTTESTNTPAPNTTAELPTTAEETSSTPITTGTTATTFASNTTSEAPTTAKYTLITTPTYIAQTTLTAKTELTIAVLSSAQPIALSAIYPNFSHTPVTPSISSETANTESTPLPFTDDQGKINLTQNTTYVTLTTAAFSSTTLVPATPVSTLSITPISTTSTTAKEDLTTATDFTKKPSTLARNTNTSASPKPEINTTEANGTDDTAISATPVTTLTITATSINTSTAESTIYTSSPNRATHTVPFSTIAGIAVVQTRLMFNSSVPIPSETLLHSAITALLSSRLTNISDSIKVLNFKYETNSNNSYVVILTFSLSNISMPEKPDLSNTETRVQNSINDALNTLLNEPWQDQFEPKLSTFTSSGKQIEGYMVYSFQDGDANTLMNFLSELQKQSGNYTSVPRSSTTVPLLSSAATPIIKSGSAVVQARLAFNSFTPIPSESLVLSAITSLLSSRFKDLSDSLTVLNFTYENVSETSYAVIFTFSISNMSIPENPDLRNGTYTQVENIINNALNTLLNAPGAEPFAPKISNFTSGKQIEGVIEYILQYGDSNIPISFLSELQKQSGNYTSVPRSSTTVPLLSSAATPIIKSGSAVVQARLAFNSFTPIPSESLVLSAITSLLSSRFKDLSDSLTVLNFTYENVSETSYAVIFTFSISNMSIPENPDLRNGTYTQVENIINNALNTLLNAPGAEPFAPKISNFTSSGKQIEGVIEYILQYGDSNIPISFLSELQKQSGNYTSVPRSSTTVPLLSSAATPIIKSGSAVVQARLAFNSFTPIPSESLVLSAITSLLSSRFKDLSDSLTVLNFTYENVSETSYAVIFTFSISNMSIPENPDLRNGTYTQVENIINNALNTLLNAPGAEPFAPKISNFTSSGKQIEGVIEYILQYGDSNIPISFLSELQKQSGNYTSVPRSSTTVPLLSSAATPIIKSGSAVVQARLAFNSFTPIPSESLVLSAITSLLSSRFKDLSDSLTVLNFTYENVSETSYAVIFTFSISNMSIPENPDLRNGTYTQVENIINNALNTLLNAPGAEPFAPKISNFTSSGKQIEGVIEYILQYGDSNIPISFLSELQKQSGNYTSVPRSSTTVPLLSSAATPIIKSGSAVVQARLAFNSFTPIPSESLVLSAITSLLSSRFKDLSDSLTVLNFTYENVSETSYAVIFTFSISNMSIPENPDLRNGTYTQVENIINNALNTLLNAPGAEPFAPKISNFTSSGKQIEGVIEYILQYGDSNIPISFLSELQKQSGNYTSVPRSSTTVPLLSSAATPIIKSGSAVVQARLAFNSFTPIPSESLVLSAITSLLSSRFKDLSDSLTVLNFTYENVSETSYAVIFTFSISNMSIPENPDLRNGTYTQVENIINNALNTLLNAPGAEPFAPKISNFTSSGKQIEGVIEYILQYGDSNIPISFLSELQKQSGNYTSVPRSSTTVPLLSSAATPIIKSGSAVVQARLAFNSFTPIPSESLVLSAITSLLSSRFKDLSDSLTVLNFTYENVSETSYAVIFTFSISNMSIPENPDLRNGTYTQVENIINNALNTLLNAPGAEPFAPKISNFTSSGKQIEGVIEYILQYGDSNIPISFLSELQKQSGNYTSVPRSSTTVPLLSSAATPIIKSGSAVVQARLAFNSFTPIPSESLVLSAITSLLSSRFKDLSDSLTVLNFTYENVSETSYAVIFTFSISNMSIPENPDLRNGTYTQVENIINNALNTLLNAPGAEPFAPKISNFTSSGKQIEGVIEYILQYGDSNIPISFLSELQKQSGNYTSVPRSSTTVPLLSSAATPIIKSGSAVVQARLAFNSFTPIPSESLVLSAITSLLSSRFKDLSDSLTVLNFTYENVSETSYAVIFTFSISNMSIPENPDLRNGTYTQVENIINNALNTLLNAPGAEPFAPKISNFISSGKQIEGYMVYSFQDGDANTLMNFLSELQKQSGNYTSVPRSSTTVPLLSSAATPIIKSGSAVVQARLAFNSFTPIPSESLVLSAITSLLSSRFKDLSDSLTVLNFTYENVSETSYAVIFTFSISNMSIPENPDLRNGTYTQVENIINNALNTLLNAPGAEPFAPKISNFTSSGKQIEGVIEYILQYGDSNIPISFLSELQKQSGNYTSVPRSSTTVPLLSSAATPIIKSGSAVVQARLAFNSFTPIPSESLVLSAITSLLSSRFKDLSDSLTVLNFTYENVSETSYAVIFTFSISNMSIPENPDLRNGTYTQVENIISNALTIILAGPVNSTFHPQNSNFTNIFNQIVGEMLYNFQKENITQLINLLNILNGLSPTTTVQSTSPPSILGTVLIYIRLVFKNLTNVPSEADVLKAANALLDSSVRLARDTETVRVYNPVSIQNVTYQKFGINSYIISFGFEISNISFTVNTGLRNETYDVIQSTINHLLNRILNAPNSTPFTFPRANYMSNSTMIVADSEYVFSEGDINFKPSGFLSQILVVSGLSSPSPNTTVPTSNLTSEFGLLSTLTEKELPGWALAIIIPCIIAIILIPCWILLCCLLCGCCAGLRRRYSRRRSYNVQYTTRNGLF
ncbi:uncharacterized protein LOC108261646 isoform X3 [Ictalurus punctatus]|uniref:Uncharacterized protein LOC108261646 isoform X3 n=1 Tax=Ictalurus punctatus TaxID=7998 RepID=A0A9F7THW8_ICTPU|nr:uncharacterized protein LOC108261646 isoform X3 [Ictalurus punctatus]